MVMFTVAACTSLFFGQEDILAMQNHDDITHDFTFYDAEAEQQSVEGGGCRASGGALRKYGVAITGEKDVPADFFTHLEEQRGRRSWCGYYARTTLTGLRGCRKRSGKGVLPGNGAFRRGPTAFRGTFGAGRSQGRFTDTALTAGKHSDDTDAVFLVARDEEAGIDAAKTCFQINEPEYETVLRLNLDASNEDGLAFGDALSAFCSSVFETQMQSGKAAATAGSIRSMKRGWTATRFMAA